MRPNRTLLLPALLALASCNADLTQLNRATCADYATKAHQCVPATTKSTFETSCAINLDTDAECRDCVVKTDCSTVVQGCSDACGKANPFVVKTSSSGTTGASGSSGTSSGGHGCSSFSLATLCDSIRPSSCGDRAFSCNGGSFTCPSNSSCTTSACSCNSGFKSVHCDTGALCNGDCAGGQWWCHEAVSPTCTTTLSFMGGTCTCLDGSSISVICSGSNASSCQELCLSAGH